MLPVGGQPETGFCPDPRGPPQDAERVPCPMVKGRVEQTDRANRTGAVFTTAPVLGIEDRRCASSSSPFYSRDRAGQHGVSASRLSSRAGFPEKKVCGPRTAQPRRQSGLKPPPVVWRVERATLGCNRNVILGLKVIEFFRATGQ